MTSTEAPVARDQLSRIRHLHTFAANAVEVLGLADVYTIDVVCYPFGGGRLGLWFTTAESADRFADHLALPPEDGGSETVYTRIGLLRGGEFGDDDPDDKYPLNRVSVTASVSRPADRPYTEPTN